MVVVAVRCRRRLTFWTIKDLTSDQRAVNCWLCIVGIVRESFSWGIMALSKVEAWEDGVVGLSFLRLSIGSVAYLCYCFVHIYLAGILRRMF